MAKTVVLGVTGSIAAYRAADLCSSFRKKEIDCRVVMTRGAREFVGTLTFSTLTQRPVITDENVGDFADRPEHHLFLTFAKGRLSAGLPHRSALRLRWFDYDIDRACGSGVDRRRDVLNL